MSITPSIISRGKEIEVIRRKPGEFENGFFVEGQVDKRFLVRASVQPLSGMERLQVPEGDRNREHINIFTKDDIRVDDTIIYNCREFEVQRIDDWEDQGLNITHRRCVAMLKDVNKQFTPAGVKTEFHGA